MRAIALAILVTISLGIPTIAFGMSDVPLPSDVQSGVPNVDTPQELGRYLGRWAGNWDGKLNHILIVETIGPQGEARGVYAWGNSNHWRIKPGWSRFVGRITGTWLSLERFGNGAEARYEFRENGTLAGTYTLRGGGTSYATMTRASAN